MSHTPGPWTMECVRTSCGVCFKVGPLSEKNGKPVHACIYADYPSPKDYALGEDNARLIAAAPDLLAALEYALFVLEWAAEDYQDNIDLRDEATRRLPAVRTALAKAKGE